ncbi:MAG: hypothetical protein AB8B64_07660 [Granulosicoccus sp.]
MSKTQSIILVALIVLMGSVAIMLGNLSEQINPDGIAPHPLAEGETAVESGKSRDAFMFGVSMGLLGCALAYCCVALGLLISARSKGAGISRFTYWIAGLAGLGFALSYLIDDYFY